MKTQSTPDTRYARNSAPPSLHDHARRQPEKDAGNHRITEAMPYRRYPSLSDDFISPGNASSQIPSVRIIALLILVALIVAALIRA